jgi:hypothetical protein
VKYFETGGFAGQPLMRLTLGLTLSLLLLFWLSNFAIYFSRMSLSPSSVVSYYQGSEVDFRPPRSAQSMLETTHMHLPMMALVLLVLTHLTIFSPLPRRAKPALIVTTFVSALLEEGGGWLVRFLSPRLALVKVLGFVGLQASILVLLLSLALLLVRARPGRRPLPEELRRES